MEAAKAGKGRKATGTATDNSNAVDRRRAGVMRGSWHLAVWWKDSRSYMHMCHEKNHLDNSLE